jgi:protein-disulfide isomerase
MSRKTASKPSPTLGKPPPVATPPAGSRRGLLIAAGAAVLVAGVGVGLFQISQRASRAQAEAAARRPGLASDHAPTIGDPGAKVHIVEFLDPACETCAVFYPMVKQMMADNPGRIRLSIRHVPFHKGADEVVRMLEASRRQDKYWQTLETLLSSQARWAPNHTARPDLARQAVAGVGLDFTRLDADMQAPDIAQRMARDRADATLLNVEQTPEYFVNGRQMASFGRQQLQNLVRQALQEAY